MHKITLTDLKRMSTNTLLGLIPIVITVDEDPKFIIDTPENVIVLSDLHPRVRAQLRAAEQKARLGMPPVEKVYASPEPVLPK